MEPRERLGILKLRRERVYELGGRDDLEAECIVEIAENMVKCLAHRD